jgi:carboxyl-terminal processing protease
MSRIRAFAILAVLLLAGRAQAQPSAAAEKIGVAERAWIASKIYSSIQLYFGHWQAVPDLDLDAAYHQYLDQAMASDDRVAFDLASKEFLAKLKNGHSGFWDSWLNDREQPVGFSLAPVGDHWVVVSSRTSALAVGDAVRLLDGKPMGEFVADRSRYIAASSDTVRRRSVFNAAFLFPRVFTLTLEDGRTVRIDRFNQKLQPAPAPVQEGRMLEGDIAFLRIPSFERPEDERAAIDFLRAHAGAKALVIDVRGNGGGNTPSGLIRAVMDRPYRDFTLSTSAFIALFGAYAQIARITPADQMSESDKGAFGALSGYVRPQIVTLGGLNTPDKPVYTGPLFVLSDIGCGSSCEDFLMPLKVSGRARILGEASTGSTGQPYYFEFGNGMGFRVSSKRESFPDGSPFEGVGIQPDVEVHPTLDDLRTGADPVLAKALELARAAHP